MTAAPTAVSPGASRTAALWAARAYYFLFFGAVGTYFPYITLYYQQTGLSGQAIGILAALMPLVTIVASPLWGALGDRFHIHRYLLPLLTWGIIPPALAITLTPHFAGLAALVALASLFFAPILPLIDSAVLDLVEETHHSYGSIRVWGTPGYMLSTWATGQMLRLMGLGALFYAYAGLLLLAGLAALWLPARRHRVATGEFNRGVGQLLRQRSIAVFLASAFLVSVAFTAYNAFFPLHLQTMGASLTLISLANILSAASELPVLFFSSWFLRRLGVRGALLLSNGIYALRWSVVALTRTPPLVLVTQGLHGISYGTMIVGGVAYMNEYSPRGLAATGQSLSNAVGGGLGAVVGALASGWLYDHFGSARLFGAMAACCAAALVIMLAAPATPAPVSPPLR